MIGLGIIVSLIYHHPKTSSVLDPEISFMLLGIFSWLVKESVVFQIGTNNGKMDVYR